MEALAAIVIIIIFIAITRPSQRSRRSSGGPTIMRSEGGYESHLDFLEMHGFITEEERRADRKAIQDYHDHPENYRTVTLEELMKEIDDEQEQK